MKMKFNLLVLVALLALTTACKKETVNDKEVLLDSTSVQRPEAVETATPTAQVPADGKYPIMTFQKKRTISEPSNKAIKSAPISNSKTQVKPI
jgi:hypothetical protein